MGQTRKVGELIHDPSERHSRPQGMLAAWRDGENQSAKGRGGRREGLIAHSKRADQLAAWCRRKSGILTLGIGDDCAVLRPVGEGTGGHHRSLTRKCSFPAGLASAAKRGPPLPGARPERSGGYGCPSRGRPFYRWLCPHELTGIWMDGFFERIRWRWLSAFGSLWRVEIWPSRGRWSPTSFCWEACPGGKRCCAPALTPDDVIYRHGRLGGSAAELDMLQRSPSGIPKILRGKDRPPGTRICIQSPGWLPVASCWAWQRRPST